jgi:hypothetical protein
MGMVHHHPSFKDYTPVKKDVYNNQPTSFIRATRIGELETTLAVTSN